MFFKQLNANGRFAPKPQTGRVPVPGKSPTLDKIT